MQNRIEEKRMTAGQKTEEMNQMLFSYFDSLIKKEKIIPDRIESSHISLQEVYGKYISFKKDVQQKFEDDEARTEFLSDVVYEIRNIYIKYLDIKSTMDKKTNQKFDFYIQEILISMRDFGFDYKKSI